MDTRKPTPSYNTPGGLPPQDVEDRPHVGEVEPEDYPERSAGADLVVPGGGSPGERKGGVGESN
jgi:hypothetical protein